MSDTPAEREGEGSWGKLRRRKVVQWGIAYAAAAWGLLQFLQFLAGTYAWSGHFLRFGTLLFAIGFPIVLTLAWYHGDRGHQKPVRSELVIIALLVLCGGGALWIYGLRSPDTRTTTEPVSAPAAPSTAVGSDVRPSIAVLPFENRSAQQDDAFFVDGIHDDILTQLTKIGAIKVIARTSVEQFRDTRLTTREIGEKLGVGRILEGGVQRAGDRVRVTVQLIDASTDAHLWAETYDRELTAANIFAIQSEVATAIAVALQATLTAREKASVAAIPTRSLEAWEAYQLGKQRMARRTSDGLVDAERYFRRAIELDAQFALAFVGLADALQLQTQYSGKPQDVTLASAAEAVGIALQLAPNLGEAWAASGAIAMARRRDAEAEKIYRRAIELNPNYASTYHWYGVLLRPSRPEESLRYVQKARELDPLSPVILENVASSLERLGRFKEAEAAYRQTIEVEPAMAMPYSDIGDITAYAFGRIADAIPYQQRAIELDPGRPEYVGSLVFALLDIGEDARAALLVKELLERSPDLPGPRIMASLIHLYAREPLLAEREAQKAAALDPADIGALAVLRNSDLERGRPLAALERYRRAYPEFFASTLPEVDGGNYGLAVDVAIVLRAAGDETRARDLLHRSATAIRSLPRLGKFGSAWTDVQIYALRGEKHAALSALRDCVNEGWRGPFWRYARDLDPALASIRDDPEFKASFAVIEQDMARQRAELAARSRDAQLESGSAD